MKNRLAISDDRVKASLGSVYALIYLGMESVGLIVLTKLLNRQAGVEEAGLASLLLTGVGLANVVLVALAVISTRTVASQLASLSELRRLQAGVIYGVAAVLGLLCVGVLAGYSVRMGVAALLFSAGVILRGCVLLRMSERVGKGEVGADKAFMMVFSLAFFGFSCVVVQFFQAAALAVAGTYFGVGLVFLVAQFGGRVCRQLLVPTRHLEWWRHGSLEKQFLAFLLMSLAGFLTMNGDVFLVSSFFGTAMLAQYSIAAKIGVGIFSVASVYPSMRLQSIASAFAAGQLDDCAKLWRECIGVAMALGGVFVLLAVVAYAPLMQWVFPGAPHLSSHFFWMICVNALLASFIAANGWPIIAAGKGNLILPTWLDGILVMGLGAAWAAWFGVAGLLAAVTVAHAVSASIHFSLAKGIFLRTERCDER